MKKLLSLMLASAMALCLCSCTDPDSQQPEVSVAPNSHPIGEVAAEKPAIYLYPEAETEVTVSLGLKGELTASYPKYDVGWTVTAAPDGTLTDRDGKEYYCLYWEGQLDAQYDMTRGFVVSGEDTAEFLEDALTDLGLNDKERNEFIIYWLGRMEENPYNLISFQTDAYTDGAELQITPKPDSLLRVFMAYEPLDEPVEVQPQKLDSLDRTGFTAVEWGGCEIK